MISVFLSSFGIFLSVPYSPISEKSKHSIKYGRKKGSGTFLNGWG